MISLSMAFKTLSIIGRLRGLIPFKSIPLVILFFIELVPVLFIYLPVCLFIFTRFSRMDAVCLNWMMKRGEAVIAKDERPTPSTNNVPLNGL